MQWGLVTQVGTCTIDEFQYDAVIEGTVVKLAGFSPDNVQVLDVAVRKFGASLEDIRRWVRAKINSTHTVAVKEYATRQKLRGELDGNLT